MEALTSTIGSLKRHLPIAETSLSKIESFPTSDLVILDWSSTHRRILCLMLLSQRALATEIRPIPYLGSIKLRHDGRRNREGKRKSKT